MIALASRELLARAETDACVRRNAFVGVMRDEHHDSVGEGCPKVHCASVVKDFTTSAQVSWV